MTSQLITLTRLGGSICGALATVGLIFLDANLLLFVGVAVLSAAVSTGLSFAAYTSLTRRQIPWSIDWSSLWALIRNGFPLMLSGLTIVIYMRIDQVMPGMMVSERELGYYTVAARIAEMGNIIPMAIHSAIFPTLVISSKATATQWQGRARVYFTLMAVVGYCTVASGLLLGPLAFYLIFSQLYAPSIGLFQTLIIGNIFICIGIASGAYLTIANRFWILTARTLLGAVLNVALNFLLIPRYGAYGAAWATIAAYWLACHGAFIVLPGCRSLFFMVLRGLLCLDAPRLPAAFRSQLTTGDSGGAR